MELRDQNNEVLAGRIPTADGEVYFDSSGIYGLPCPRCREPFNGPAKCAHCGYSATWEPEEKQVGILSDAAAEMKDLRTVKVGTGRWLLKSLSGATDEIIYGELSFLINAGLLVVETEEPAVPFVMNLGAFESATKIEDEDEE